MPRPATILSCGLHVALEEDMVDILMRRVDGFCRLFLALKHAGIEFPHGGEIFSEGGALCWNLLECGHYHLMLTFARRKNDRLALTLRQTALAIELLSFVTFVPSQDWQKTGLLDFMVDPDDLTEEAVLGVSDEPTVCVNLRAHLNLPVPTSAEGPQ